MKKFPSMLEVVKIEMLNFRGKYSCSCSKCVLSIDDNVKYINNNRNKIKCEKGEICSTENSIRKTKGNIMRMDTSPARRIKSHATENNYCKFSWIQLSLIYFVFTQYWIQGKILPDENGPLSEVQTAVGLEVSLPCDLTSGTLMTDKIQLVIWYKEGNIMPIYTFDARGKPLQQAVHWADQDVLKKKAHFFYDTNPPVLKIKGVQKDDAGQYRCRVDFHKSPTRNWRINLTVLVPPSQLIILDTFGAAVTENIIGPYNEGSNINMTCLSSGGIPPPRVSWWKEHALLDESFQILPDGTVKNILHLNKISRKDLHTVYTCQASNGHVVPPLSSTVKLDMKLPPLYIRLQGLNHPLVAGVRTQITCTSAGAKPPPQIVWEKGGQKMRGATQTVSSDGNVTVSELIFIPVPEDNGKQVICSVKSETPSTTGNGVDVSLKDSRTLDVKHAPIVSLNLGAPLDPNNLMKGSDVYLECDIKANPSAKKVEWYHNDKLLYPSRGVIISNQTLVLQGISKATHGQYLCRATNVQGTVASNEVYLDVKYPPTCKSEANVIRAALKQTINITCEVDANPMTNLTFKWHFNNTLETIIELPDISTISSLPLISQGAGHGQSPQPSSLSSSWTTKFRNNNKNVAGPSASRWSMFDSSEDDDDDDAEDNEEIPFPRGNRLAFNSPGNLPYSQAVYSNLAYQQNFERLQKQQSLYQKSDFKGNQHGLGSANERSRRQRQQPPLNNVYQYKVESFSSFGTVSCIASNLIGQSLPCLYHIIAAELPDPVKNCTAFNATANSIQIFCIPGSDGGIQQHFHVEVYDELNQQILHNTSYKYSEFTVKRLPSDSVFVIRVTSYNLQGFSNRAFRIRAKTLSAPLLRTASSTAVLVQLTPLLGALVGVVVTLILVTMCIVIFIKFKTKHNRNITDSGVTTEMDKGSAEPLSRNMGSHSSLEDKNPDVIPQENSEDEYNLEEKAFDRLNMESQRILYTPPRLTTVSPPLSPTFAKQYGELSLTTNPSFNFCNSPQRMSSQPQRSIYGTAPSPLLSNARSPPPKNIYTRIPSTTRTFLSTTGTSAGPGVYETRTSPISPYEPMVACTMPLLGNHFQKPDQQSQLPNLQLQGQQQQQQSHLQLSPSAAAVAINNSQLLKSNQYQQHQQQQPSTLLITNGGGILGNYDENS